MNALSTFFNQRFDKDGFFIHVIWVIMLSCRFIFLSALNIIWTKHLETIYPYSPEVLMSIFHPQFLRAKPYLYPFHLGGYSEDLILSCCGVGTVPYFWAGDHRNERMFTYFVGFRRKENKRVFQVVGLDLGHELCLQ